MCFLYSFTDSIHNDFSVLVFLIREKCTRYLSRSKKPCFLLAKRVLAKRSTWSVECICLHYGMSTPPSREIFGFERCLHPVPWQVHDFFLILKAGKNPLVPLKCTCPVPSSLFKNLSITALFPKFLFLQLGGIARKVMEFEGVSSIATPRKHLHFSTHTTIEGHVPLLVLEDWILTSVVYQKTVLVVQKAAKALYCSVNRSRGLSYETEGNAAKRLISSVAIRKSRQIYPRTSCSILSTLHPDPATARQISYPSFSNNGLSVIVSSWEMSFQNFWASLWCSCSLHVLPWFVLVQDTVVKQRCHPNLSTITN